MRAPIFTLTAAFAVTFVPSFSVAAQSTAPAASVMYSTSPLLAAREASPNVIRMTPIAPDVTTTAAAEDGEGPSTAGKVFRAAVGIGVGAAVGGWLGYFGAQVANGDWARITPAEKTNLRQNYTKVGLG